MGCPGRQGQPIRLSGGTRASVNREHPVVTPPPRQGAPANVGFVTDADDDSVYRPEEANLSNTF